MCSIPYTRVPIPEQGFLHTQCYRAYRYPGYPYMVTCTQTTAHSISSRVVLTRSPSLPLLERFLQYPGTGNVLLNSGDSPFWQVLPAPRPMAYGDTVATVFLGNVFPGYQCPQLGSVCRGVAEAHCRIQTQCTKALLGIPSSLAESYHLGIPAAAAEETRCAPASLAAPQCSPARYWC